MQPVSSPTRLLFVFFVLLLAAVPVAAEEEVVVPDLTGLDPEAAQERLDGVGLYGNLIEVAGPAVGKVSAQDPPAGTRMPRNGVVDVRYGIRARIETIFPDVIGEPVETALDKLLSAYDVHLRPHFDANQTPGHVARTDPAPGSTVWFRAPVTVYIYELSPESIAPPGISPDTPPSVPPITGPTPPPLPTPTQPPVNPPGSTPALPPMPPLGPPPGGRTSPLDPPVGPAPSGPSRMPDLIGTPIAEALPVLEQMGFDVEITPLRDLLARPGTILGQLPAAHAEVQSGTSVRLRVATRDGETIPGLETPGRVDPGSVDPGVGTPPPTVPLPPAPGIAPPPSQPPLVPLPPPSSGPPPAAGGSMDELLPPGAVVPEWLFEGRPTQVPLIVGNAYRTACRRLIAVGLVPRPWLIGHVRGTGHWQVMTQKIAPETELPTGSPVDFRVSMPPGGIPEEIGAPPLVGLSLHHAERVMREFGITPVVHGLREADSMVLHQLPPPEAALGRNSTMEVWVVALVDSSEVPPAGGFPTPGTVPPPGTLPPPGAGTFPTQPPVEVPPAAGGPGVPPVGGMQATDAMALLQRAGYVVEVEYELMPSAVPGEVFRQEPPAGLVVGAGTTVRITLPVSNEMPSMLGMTLAEAVRAIGSMRLAIEIDPRPAGTDGARVIAQWPQAGLPVAAGSSIRLRLEDDPPGGGPRWKAPKPEYVRMPQVGGLSAAEAEARLTAAGLVASMQGGQAAGGRTTVVRAQGFAPGARLLRGTTVPLLVGEPIGSRTARRPGSSTGPVRGGEGDVLDDVRGFFESLPGRIEGVIRR